MKKMKYLRNILENPPIKYIKCTRCGGGGIINLRGLITSDPCPRCEHVEKYRRYKKNGNLVESYSQEEVVDYKYFEEMVREAVIAEVKAK